MVPFCGYAQLLLCVFVAARWASEGTKVRKRARQSRRRRRFGWNLRHLRQPPGIANNAVSPHHARMRGARRRTFAVLATFPGSMLSSGSGMRKRRAAHATALRVSAADAERSRAYSATRSSSVSPPAPCFRGGGSVHFGRGSRKSVRPPNAVLLYDSGDIKRLSCEAWGVLKRS